MQKAPASLLVSKVNGLGDLVAFLPTLDSVIATSPSSRVCVVAPRRHAGLIRAMSRDVDVIGVDPRVLRRPDRHLLEFLRLVATVRSRGCDVALSSHDECSGAVLLQILSGIPLRIGFERSSKLASLYTHRIAPDVSSSMLANDHRLAEAFAGLIGADMPAMSIPRLRFAPRADGTRTQGSGTTVLLHPGAQFEHKRWPVERFRRLVEEMTSADPNVSFVVLCDGPQPDLGTDRVWYVQPESTEHLCEVVAASDVAVVNNSGPMNVAWLLGVPLVVLSGPSPRYWSPPASEFTVEFRDRVACAPCEGPGWTPGRCMNGANPFACMKAIDHAEVVGAVRALLRRVDASMKSQRLRELGFNLG